MPIDAEMLMSCLTSFRPSDRAKLRTRLSDPSDAAAVVDAIKEFVAIWEHADWLDANSIERIGRWVGRTQDDVIVNSLEDWARQSRSEARHALAVGLGNGRDVRREKPASPSDRQMPPRNPNAGGAGG